MKKIGVVLGVVLLTAVVSVNAQAYRGNRSMGPGAGYGNEFEGRMAANLNLTAEQTAQIREFRETQLKEIQPLQTKLYNKRNDLRLLWLQQKPDQGKIEAANRDIRTLRDQIEDKMTSHRLTVLKILTPEQQAKMQTYGQGRGYSSGMNRRMGMRGY